MPVLDTKSQILDEAGYVYSFDRMIYVNRQAKKVFSTEFIDDHTEETLQTCIEEKPAADGWQFYFTSPPSDEVRRDLENALK